MQENSIILTIIIIIMKNGFIEQTARDSEMARQRIILPKTRRVHKRNIKF